MTPSDACAAAANTNQLLVPAADAVVSLFDHATLRVAIINTVTGCLLAPVAVTTAAYDTLRAIANASVNPGAAALRALAGAILADGSNRHDYDIAARDPEFFEPEELDYIVAKSLDIAALLTALRDHPASASPTRAISLANAL